MTLFSVSFASNITTNENNVQIITSKEPQLIFSSLQYC